MDYIHRQGVCHRDLKPENLLLNGASILKISDFGLSSVYKLKTGQTRSLTERCGSLPYVAPELNSNQPYEAEPIDVWGCGVILFTLLVGNTPWDEPTKHSPEFYRYLKGTIFEEEPWNRISDEALSLLKGMLEVNPADRMTLEDVSQHPWCMRPSQIANLNPIQIAEMLTSELRANGDLDVATPNMGGDAMDVDEDGYSKDPAMTPVTQKLQLFSQTQSGLRFCPNLTRFYTIAPPPKLLPLIQVALEENDVKCKLDQRTGSWVLRIGGFDNRKQRFKGWVNLEYFEIPRKYLSQPASSSSASRHRPKRDEDEDEDEEDEDYMMDEDSQDTITSGLGRRQEEEEEEEQGPPVHGSFVSMARDEGNPISWRRLWRTLITSEQVKEHVLVKKGRKL
ncbi:kinase-like domain-containing protein [Coprinopsis sp. MPI-PUGE-AT-0042]|nr:kinase-like domain-containing protein [Coprinopsis sp. MPI-PUGE-AT-0042]